MKNKIILFCSCLMIGLMAGAAMAITTVTVLPGQMQTNEGTLVQNISAIAPKKAGNVCVAKVIHNAGDIVTFNTYTSNRWYQKADWQAVKTTDGTPFVVQRVLGNNTTGTVGSTTRPPTPTSCSPTASSWPVSEPGRITSTATGGPARTPRSSGSSASRSR